MGIGWWGVLDQVRVVAILVGTLAIVYAFVVVLVRGVRRGWPKAERRHLIKSR